MDPIAGTPAADDERSEELRLALVLNGGVSLAVWMGGVAYELNRLVRETHPVYGGLLRLTRTKARIDVISGTSAGGINGAALALAQVHDSSLYGLREVWLSSGGLEKLMRDPHDADPPSLLQGDAYFLPKIEQALEGIARGPIIDKAGAPMLLSLTTTLLHGVGKTQLDDFGALIEDTVHRAHFAFERRDGAADDDFCEHSGIVRQLALAARASASFPVAFEPSLHVPGSPPFGDKRPLREQGGAAEPVSGPTYLLDGGILDNRPFDAALEAISKLPADGNTRRVLAYIAPDPKAAIAPPKLDAEGKPTPPTLAAVAAQSTVGIPGTQSIADQLAYLRQYGDDMRKRWQRINGLLRHAPQGDGVLQVAALMFPAYRARRLDGAIDHLLDELVRGLSMPAADPGAGMRRSTRLWLRGLWLETRDELDPWSSFIPARFVPVGPDIGPPEPSPIADGATEWRWGQYTLEFMAGVVIDVLRRTQRLSDLVARWQEARPGVRVTKGPSLATAADPPLRPGMHWEQVDRERSVLTRRAQAGAAAAPAAGHDLRGVWASAYEINLRLRRRRQDSNRAAREAGRAAFAKLLDDWRRRGTPPEPEARALIRQLVPAEPPVQGQPTRLQSRLADARSLCRALLALRPAIDDILAAAPARSGATGQVQADTRADVVEALEELKAYRDYFFASAAELTVDDLAVRLLALEVIEVAAGSREERPDVGAELVQISARLQSPWGGPATPQGKLTGMGLAHFAAFYKRSWRANDWIYGRLDGIDRVLRIALNPDRLQRLYGERAVRTPEGLQHPASAYVMNYLETLAVTSAAAELRPALDAAWRDERALIEAELAWLDARATVPPPVLSRCAAALTRRLHLEVLMRELPDLADAMDQDQAIGASPSPAGSQLRARLARMHADPAWAPDIAVSLLKDSLLGSDTLAQEVGTDHFTRTVAQTVAVAHATASSSRSGLNSLNVLLKLTEWPIAVFHWLAGRLSQGHRTAIAVESASLGVGVALVAATLLAQQMPAAVTTVGWGLIAGGLIATLVRSWRMGLAFAIAIGALLSGLGGAKVLVPLGALLVILVWPAIGSLLAVLAALWWSAGAPALSALPALACTDALQGLGRCPRSASAADVQAAELLLQVAAPALLVLLALCAVLLARRARRSGRLQSLRRRLGIGSRADTR